jgi:hypothetical protein
LIIIFSLSFFLRVDEEAGQFTHFKLTVKLMTGSSAFNGPGRPSPGNNPQDVKLSNRRGAVDL